jgi:hypothetical protein
VPRKTFVAGEILTALDVNTNLMDQAVMTFADATERTAELPSPLHGMVTYLKDTDSLEVFDNSAFVPVGVEPAPPAILQVVRATSSTNESTSNTSFTDANISVTITPTASDSGIILVYSAQLQVNGGTTGDQRTELQITDASNTAVSGAEAAKMFINFGTIIPSVSSMVQLWGYDEPGVATATTYKVRHRSINSSNTSLIRNSESTGQLYAIEVAG